MATVSGAAAYQRLQVPDDDLSANARHSASIKAQNMRHQKSLNAQKRKDDESAKSKFKESTTPLLRSSIYPLGN